LPEVTFHLDTTVVRYIVLHRSDRIIAAIRDLSIPAKVGFLAGMVLPGGLVLHRKTGS